MAALGGTGLGGLLDSITSSVQTLASSITKPSAPPPPPSSGPMPPIGACTQAVDATSPTGYQTFIWQDQAYVKQADGTYAMQTVAPFWAPLRAGQTCASQWTGPGGVGTVQQNFGSGGGASVLSTDPTAGFPTPEAQAHLHVGPFSFSGYPDYNGKPGRPGDYKHQDMGFYRFTRPSPAQVIPPAVMKLFTDAVKRGGTAQGKDASGGLFDPYQSTRPTSLATYQRWLAIFGLPDLGPGNFYRALLPVYSYVAAEVQTPSVFEFTWGNKPWYVKFMLAPPAAVFPAWPGDDSYKVTNSALAATPDQPLDLLVYVHRKPTGTLQDVGGALDAAGQAVMTVVSGLATIACGILTNPNSVKEGAAVGGAAGATGAAVGGALCGGTSPQPTASSSSGILPWIIGGAAGLTALLILSSPKKKPKPPSGGAPP